MQPEALARCILAGTPGADPRALPAARQQLRAAVGACVAARRQPHVQAALLAIDQPGPCTVFGHPQTLGVEGAAFVGGVAAQDDEGHAVVLAVLAAAQRHGVGALLELTEGQLASAVGLAAGMASPPHAAGPGMPQLQAGWAAQAGYRAVRLAMSAFGGFGGYVAAPALFEGLDDPLLGLGETWRWLDEDPARQALDFHALCAQGDLPAEQAQALEAALDGLFRRPFIDTDALAF
jgi:2-methylcitrate dehydratase PrpD